MTIPSNRIPARAGRAWTRLRDELSAILGNDLVAAWAFGGTVLAPEGAPLGDLDTFVVVGHPIDESRMGAIDEVEARIAADEGVVWDTWYVLEADARRGERPHHAVRDRINETWAIDRAHWLAGRYVLLHGKLPADIVAAPTGDEIATALHSELEHLERHVAAGDTDPYEATYALLNGSRIVHAMETGNPAISKREAGTWGIEHLPDRWRPALEAAVRTYEDRASTGDTHRIARDMAPFVAMVRDRLQRH